MKVRKYNARTSRDALRQVREDLGPDAVILANRLVKGGVEIMAMAASDLAAQTAAAAAAQASQPLEVGEDDIVVAPPHVLARRSAARRALTGLGLETAEPAAPRQRPPAAVPAGDALFEPLAILAQPRREPAPGADEVPAEAALAATRARLRRGSILGLKPEPAPLDLPTAGTGSGAPAVLRRRPLLRGETGDHAWIEQPAAAARPAAPVGGAAAMRALAGNPVAVQAQVQAAVVAMAPAAIAAFTQTGAAAVPTATPAAAPAAVALVADPVDPAGLVALAKRHDPLMSALADEVRSLGSMLGHNLGAAPAAPPAVPAATVMEAVEEARPSGGDDWVRNMMGELRSMRVLIEDQIGAMAFADAGRMPPGKARVVRLLSAAGFSAALIRKLTARLPENVPEPEAVAFVRAALRNNLSVAGSEAELLDQGGVCALVGPTGAGKTTTAAKLAARFVVRHGAENMALLTTDGYRIGGQEQLRIYGRILGVAVHAVKDAEDLRRTLGELRNRKLVLIDTVGLSQRDGMVNDQHQMFANCGVPVRRLLLLNATCHGDTLADVGRAYRGNGLAGCILTKLDEAAAPGAALDAAIRQRLRVFYAADGQRVPEDLHLADAGALIERVLNGVAELELAKQDEADFPFEAPPALVQGGLAGTIGEGEVLNG